MTTFTPHDIQAITSHGLTPQQVEQQIQQFQQGFPHASLQEAATVGNGIIRLSPTEAQELAEAYQELIQAEEVVKFVPASGAASRMFKQLFAFSESFSGTPEDYEALMADQTPESMFYLLDNLKELSFFPALEQAMSKDNLNINDVMASKDYKTVVDYILEEKGLGYGSLPKGLILFHQYEHEVRLAFEEHIVEGYHYCRNGERINLHFTVSPEHLALFQEQAAQLQTKYKNQYGFAPEIHFSTQKPSTDTVAVNPDNTLFRNEAGEPLFRPGGHGALIENLNDLKAGLVFIKNIDNVVPDRLKEDTYLYKKACGAMLLQLRNQAFKYLEDLEKESLSAQDLETIYRWSTTQLFTEKQPDFQSLSQEEKRMLLKTALNRPIRICGMVKNEGEPGGGPFLVTNEAGHTSLQIVESAQIDLSKEDQQKIVASATHFNPVDLICSYTDYKGKPFNLKEYVDHNTGFISEKSKDGKPLKALELPGLWNGAMAHWNTLFVEVPITTFNPVKTVNDLLRPQHR
ncbi:MAG: NAD metabolism ATPase/kinase [Bacteroidetes bacterium]|nr:MAG: NAD metabolism ATPase/kinase [Bacteroidota bacterium]PIE88098.1 MAG: NAD metabolism ATPase/kinase [Bacteroidota bacterium]